MKSALLAVRLPRTRGKSPRDPIAASGPVSGRFRGDFAGAKRARTLPARRIRVPAIGSRPRQDSFLTVPVNWRDRCSAKSLSIACTASTRRGCAKSPFSFRSSAVHIEG